MILICPKRHSNREQSDTSINSPSSTKFTLVFRKAQYFISSCRISQSYFQSWSCHHGVAVRQLVVIMTIYSSGSEVNCFSLSFQTNDSLLVHIAPRIFSQSVHLFLSTPPQTSNIGLSHLFFCPPSLLFLLKYSSHKLFSSFYSLKDSG